MQTFATPAPITAVVAIPAGRIQFTAADRDSTTVEIRPANPAKSRDVKLAGQTTAAYSDGTLRITTRQEFQLHGVLKDDLKSTIRAINESLLSTLAA